MGLAGDLRQAVNDAFIALDDIPVNVTFKYTVVGAYNPTTDATARTTQTQTVKALRTKDKFGEFDFKPNMKTVRLVVPALRLNTIPQIEDTILMDNVEFEIVDKKDIPSQALYILQVRAA